MPKLIIQRDRAPNTIALTQERVTIGRHPRNDIVLTDAAISAEHAVIVTILDDSFLEDLGSTNGTFVNGHRIGKHFLQHRDKLALARCELEFVADGVRPMIAAAQPSPPARIELLDGANAGRQMTLTKPETRLGRDGAQVAAIHQQLDGHTIVHIDGAAPLVNGVALGARSDQ